MNIGLAALTLRPACVLGFFFVRREENRFRLIVDYCHALKSIPLTSLAMSLLACTTGVVTLQTLFTGCASLGRFVIFSAARGSNKDLKVTEIDGTTVSPSQTLWPMCFSLPGGSRGASSLLSLRVGHG